MSQGLVGDRRPSGDADSNRVQARAPATRDYVPGELKVEALAPERENRQVEHADDERHEFAQPGTNLTMFVPDDIWVWANFKETQLDYMQPGQRMTLEIDAYPERVTVSATPLT
jgi:membrane fusion protein, multidrug efflux system